MKYIVIIIALLTQLTLNAQSEKGINFQAVARNADGSILSNKDISVRLSLRQGSVDGLIEYQEIKTVSTNVVGLFNLVFGSKENSNIVVIGEYNLINWNSSNKYLQVEIDPFNSINFIYLGTQKINYVPYALVAASVDMSNVNGLTNSLNNKLSISDTANMLKAYLKPIAGNLEAMTSTSTLGTIEKPFKGLYISSGSLSFASDDLNKNIPPAIISNVNGNLQISAGGMKIMGNSAFIAPRIEGELYGNAKTATLAGNITATSNTSLTSLPNLNTIGTITTGTWSASTIDIANGGTGATTIAGAKQNLLLNYVDNTSDLTKPISNSTQIALDTKENMNNKSTNLNTDGSSNTKYPTVKAVKDYVDATTVSGAPDADSTTKGIIKLTGDLSGTANLPTITNNAITSSKIANLNVTDEKINTVSGSKVTGNISGNAATASLAGNITATSNTSLTSLSNLNTVGTIATGTWSATSIDIAHGGTGAANTSMARQNLGLVIGTDVQAPLTGTGFVKSNSGIISYDNNNYITGNQNITLVGDLTGAGTTSITTTIGNNKVVNNMLAGNITASKLVGTDINTLGTITTGTWSASTIDITHGGTGASSLSGVLIGTNGSGATSLRTAAYGSFFDLTDQTVSAINSPTAMSYSNTDFNEGVSIESNGTKLTRIKVANTGKYNIQFSAQLGRSGGTSTETISIWLRKNGVDVPATCTDVVIHGSAALSDLVAAWNFFQSLQANDYIEIMWSSTDTNLLIDAQLPRTSPTRPAVPSIILTVQQIY